MGVKACVRGCVDKLACVSVKLSGLKPLDASDGFGSFQRLEALRLCVFVRKRRGAGTSGGKRREALSRSAATIVLNF